MKKLIFALPLLFFILIASILFRGLSLHPSRIPSPLIDKPAPSFHLSSLWDTQTISNQDLIGKIHLLNVWATWCYACAFEHDFLLTLSKDKRFSIIGLNYKDDPKAAKAWLKQHGNPYEKVAIDASGETAIDWGVYGTPETFLVDQHGIIRYKHIGPLSEDDFQTEILPLIESLRKPS